MKTYTTQFILSLLFVSILLFISSSQQPSDRVLDKSDQHPLQVIRVIDGDTLIARIHNKDTRIRISYIDAPENDQPFGKASTKYLEKLTRHTSSIKIRGKDKYGRTLASLYTADGEDIGFSLVSHGYAWCHNKRTSFLAECKALLRTAQKQKRGLWQQKNPLVPWKYRQQKM